MNRLDWRGCYNARWGGVIVDEAIRHPAKFSRGLVERVYRHLLTEGYLRPGDTVLDPFGGVALGAWPALRQGVNWIGVELEPHFVDLGRANLDLWQSRYAAWFPQWGQALLLHGDSRRLDEVLGQVEAQAIIGSPPYGRGCAHQGGADEPGKAGNQLGRAAYGPGCAPDGQPEGRYGQSDGQLASLPEGNVAAVISSPPYEGSVNQHLSANDAAARLERMRQAGIDVSQPVQVSGPNGSHYTAQAYGNTPGQMGATKGETFWEAARLVVEQYHALLKPDGVAVWNVKDFVRGKAIVPFTADWQRLCEACGLETVESIRAWLVNPGPTQLNFAGDDVDYTTNRKGFWRRLHEKKYPHLAINWEVVLVMRKISQIGPVFEQKSICENGGPVGKEAEKTGPPPASLRRFQGGAGHK